MTAEKNGIGLFTCVTILIGGMIGSAIFSLSGLTMYMAGPASVLSWVIAALIMLVYGLSCAELASVYPHSGGIYVFPARAFGVNTQKGAFIGWLSTFGYINSNIVAVSFAAIYVGTYLGVGFSLDSSFTVPLAILTIAVAFVLNILALDDAGRLNSILVACLAATLIVYVCACFFSGKWNPSFFEPFFCQGTSGKTGFISAVPTALLGYGSIVSVAFIVSEVRDPSRNVPKSALIAMAIVAILYVAVILATLGVVPVRSLIDNPVLRYTPLYAASQSPLIAKIVSVSAVLALVTTAVVMMALTSRAIQAASEDGAMLPCFSRLNKAGVPAFASACVAVPAAVIACFPEFTEQIVGFGALFSAVSMAVNFISLFKTRKTAVYPDDAFHAPGGNFVSVIAFAALLLCYIPDIISGGWRIWLYTILWYLAGIAAFYIFRRNFQRNF